MRDHYFYDDQIEQDPILKYFDYAHLPEHLREVSETFADQAMTILTYCPRNPERSVALRKLLEAKDCAVRSML